GGGFRIYKRSSESFNKVEDREAPGPDAGEKSNIAWVVVQIMVVDIVFSLDSVITAVGIADHVWVMATAMVLAVMVMMTFAGPVGEFVTRHPSIQILALSFLLLIGVLLLAEGFGQHVSKGYVYFAMGFSLFVELTNMRQRSKRKRALSQEEAQR
ncbi:MAG TPA: TerC family protein, partial [Sorangium sp.]|nr:TerC family protein [Sorangium sp.]